MRWAASSPGQAQLRGPACSGSSKWQPKPLCRGRLEGNLKAASTGKAHQLEGCGRNRAREGRWGPTARGAGSLSSFESSDRSDADTYYVPGLQQPCCVRATGATGSAEQVHGEPSICPVFCRAWASLSCPPSPRSLKIAKADPPQPRLHQVQGKQLRCLHRLHRTASRASGQQAARLRVANRKTQGVRAPSPLSRALDNRG